MTNDTIQTSLRRNVLIAVAAGLLMILMWMVGVGVMMAQRQANLQVDAAQRAVSNLHAAKAERDK